MGTIDSRFLEPVSGTFVTRGNETRRKTGSLGARISGVQHRVRPLARRVSQNPSFVMRVLYRIWNVVLQYILGDEYRPPVRSESGIQRGTLLSTQAAAFTAPTSEHPSIRREKSKADLLLHSDGSAAIEGSGRRRYSLQEMFAPGNRERTDSIKDFDDLLLKDFSRLMGGELVRVADPVSE